MVEGSFTAVRDYRHELRITSNVSPYPALESYKKQNQSSLRGEDIVPWLNEPRSFYAGQLPDDLEKARATDDDTTMGCHTSDCIMS